MHAGDESDDKQGQHAVAQPALLGAGGEAVFLTAAMNPRDDVLEDAQRANYRAIDAAENEGEQHQCHDDHYIECQQRGQELDARRPPQIVVQHAAHVKKQQRDQDHHDGGQCDADFP